MYYHIYKYLIKTRDISGALNRWDQRRVKYFWNWILENPENYIQQGGVLSDELLKDKPPYNRNSIAETFTNQNDYKSRPPRYSYDACPSVDTDKYVHISQLANKCYGCNPYSLIEHSNYIRKDFQ